MMYRILLVFLLALSQNIIIVGQTTATNKKTIKAIYIEEKPKIDGVLDEEVWQNAPIATDFVEFKPAPYTKPSQRTEVKVLYTTEGIYIGAKMYDSSPDSILKQLSIRDVLRSVNTDFFAVNIDGMFTQQSDFSFGVTAAGVQVDESNGSNVWDAVWTSEVKILADGWVVEMEIPYSQLRFPSSKKQTWGINFIRMIRRTRELFFWNSLDPAGNNRVQQFGLLTGIERIKPPVRLSVTPYLAAYVNHSYDATNNTSSVSPRFSAGADLKYGINESFTLDVALIPDFGDVQSDNVVYNLSPFEIRYAERRPFFTEGVDLFQKAGLFYSRRIGSNPEKYGSVGKGLKSHERLLHNPKKPYLVNALKVSGRTKKGLGLGIFNAITAPSFAQIEDSNSGEIRKQQTEGFSNYNVIVADQQFWKHSYISLINTSVIRFGGHTDALATGTEFKIADKNNNWGVKGSAAMSHRFLDTSLYTKAYENGYRYHVEFNKFRGNFKFSLGQRTMSKDYNINDIGYLSRANYVNTYATFLYNTYQPKGAFLQTWSNLKISYNRLYNPSTFTSLSVGGEWGGTLPNFLSIGADARIEPLGNYNYFEARTDGRYWAKPVWTRLGVWFSSDYRKAFALDGVISYRKFWGQGAWANSDVIGLELQPLIRFSDQFNMQLKGAITWRNNSLGYVTKISQVNGSTAIIFGSRKRQDLESTINANYLFNNKISLSLRLRHYWARVEYLEYYELGDKGEMQATNYNNNHNTNYNAFNLDLIFRWRFAPGSELNIVWKNMILDNQNIPSYDYFQNFGGMFDSGQNNQFSIKALYYLDFFKVLKKNKGTRLD